MKPIFIVGYMGSGKSTLGRKLAELLGLNFIDTDVFIENRFKQRIVDMFPLIGEEAFRRREHTIIEELSGMTDCVLATGGGLPCYHNNMALMLESGLTIYLEASPEALAQRLELCKRTRPTIKDKTGQELYAHIQEALALRSPIYEQAHWRVSIEHVCDKETETLLAEDLAKRIEREYR